MFKRVDAEEEPVTGFSYSNASGDTEVVRLDHVYVSIEYADTGDHCHQIMYNDIPKAIKALQAAYNHKKGI